MTFQLVDHSNRERRDMKRVVSGIMLTLLLAVTIFLAFTVRPAAAAVTVYINSDGSVSPSSAPISSPDNITYTFTGNINYPTYDGIVVAKSNIVINGNGYTVQGSMNDTANGLDLTDINNVTIRNVNVQHFECGIYLSNSNHNAIFESNLNANSYGIRLYSSPNNIISGNNASTNSQIGIRLDTSSSYNNVSGNTVSTNSLYGIFLSASSNNNTVNGNTLTANSPYGFALLSSSNNTMYQNNFIGNSNQVYVADNASVNNAWDRGYPSGGNYWSNYNGTDLYSGSYQNVTGSDGIGDTSYVVYANNTDHYPLMGSCGSSTRAGLNVTVFLSEHIALTFQNVTAPGLATVNETPTFAPPLSSLVGDYYEVRVNATFTGNVTVRLIFDGSNMTEQQKSNLRMLQYTPLIADMSGSTPGVSDGVVNMRDIAYIIAHFASTPNSTNWNPRCDIFGPSGAPDGVSICET